MGKMVKPSKDFQEKEALIKLQHDNNMEELKYRRESDRLHHEREMERQRIKSAEIRKMQMRKQGLDPYKS